MRQQRIGPILGALVLAPMLTAVGQGTWVEPKCSLKPGHFMVNSGVLYLRNAAKTKFDDQREKDLREASRVLNEAVTSGDQGKNAAAWYYLGRYYIVRNDALGADTAFRKAEALMPACRDDILFWRRNSLWVPALKDGLAALNAQQYDSAIALLRRAALIYDAEPHAFTALAAAFFNVPAATFLPESVFNKAYTNLSDSAAKVKYDSIAKTRYDSAAKYFHLGIQAASDPKFANEKKDAMFNLGNAFYAGQQLDSAAAAFAEYLRVTPNDAEALTRLGDVLAAAGRKDSAMAIYRQIIANAESMDPVRLINTGASIFNAAPPVPDTAALGTTCRKERRGVRATLTAAQRGIITAACDSVTKQALRERNSAAADNYRLAARAFEAALAKSPRNRDGLYNLTNAYYALREPDKMLAVGQRLIEIDPMSRDGLRLVGQAWQLKSKSDSAYHYFVAADSLLPVEVTVSSFGPDEQSATLAGLVTNFHDKPSAPLKLVFEFLGADGHVVASQSEDVPAIAAGANHPFQLQAIGAGVAAWRYKKG